MSFLIGMSITVDEGGKSHIFYAQHTGHPKIKEVYAKWESHRER